MVHPAPQHRDFSPLERQWFEYAETLGPRENTVKIVADELELLRGHHLPTYEHCLRVGILSAEIGKIANLHLRPLFYAGSLHDIGKLEVDTQILGKTTEWTPHDADALKDHPVEGFERIKRMGLTLTASIAVLHHTYQSNSYPAEIPPIGAALSGDITDEITTLGRALALADFFDAAHRPNQGGRLSPAEVRTKLESHNVDMAELIDTLYETGVFDMNYGYSV